MTAEWEPIRRTGAPAPQGVEERSGRIVLVFPLSATPPREWTEYARKALAGIVDRETRTPDPRVDGNTIVVNSLPSEADFKAWTENVDRRIEEANRHYTDTVLVAREQREETDRTAEEQRSQLLEEARGWAASLDEPES